MPDDLLLMLDDDEDERLVREARRLYRAPKWWPYLWFGIAFVIWLTFAAWIGFPSGAILVGTAVLALIVYRHYRHVWA